MPAIVVGRAEASVPLRGFNDQPRNVPPCDTSVSPSGHVAMSSGPAPHSPLVVRVGATPRMRVNVSMTGAISPPNATGRVAPDAGLTRRRPSPSSASRIAVAGTGSPAGDAAGAGAGVGTGAAAGAAVGRVGVASAVEAGTGSEARHAASAATSARQAARRRGSVMARGSIGSAPEHGRVG